MEARFGRADQGRILHKEVGMACLQGQLREEDRDHEAWIQIEKSLRKGERQQTGAGVGAI